MNKLLIENLLKNHKDITLVMASKYLDSKAFTDYLDAGIRHFGESRVEAFLEKEEALRARPMKWHFLGTLQSKKVKTMINKIDVLHSLDRMSLAKAIEKRREGTLPCLIQVNISGEASKHGVLPENTLDFIEQLQSFESIKVIGLMGIAVRSDDDAVLRGQFSTLRELRDKAIEHYPQCKELSMGMSEDYTIAIEEGATMLRLGRILITEGLE